MGVTQGHLPSGDNSGNVVTRVACLWPGRPRGRPALLHRGPSEPSRGRLPMGSTLWARAL
eukprot:6451885-Alexandrium_andersonii.AAC.1